MGKCISLIGSHGTGKSTVFEEIRRTHQEWQYFSEPVRHQMPAFGYENPYEIVNSLGIGIFELMNINSWSVIDQQTNSALTQGHIITDRSSVDNYGYYLTLRKTPIDYAVGDLIKRMAMHYSSLIDIFVYFPLGALPLKQDQMRPGDEEYQIDLDRNILVAISELEIPERKIYKLKSTNVAERAKEIIELLI